MNSGQFCVKGYDRARGLRLQVTTMPTCHFAFLPFWHHHAIFHTFMPSSQTYAMLTAFSSPRRKLQWKVLQDKAEQPYQQLQWLPKEKVKVLKDRPYCKASLLTSNLNVFIKDAPYCKAMHPCWQCNLGRQKKNKSAIIDQPVWKTSLVLGDKVKILLLSKTKMHRTASLLTMQPWLPDSCKSWLAGRQQ